MTYKSVNQAWLVETAIQIRKGNITMTQAAKNVMFDTAVGIKIYQEINRNTLSRYFKINNIKVFDVGRKGFRHSIDNIRDDVIYVINDLQVGITKTWMILNRKGKKCSRNEVEQIFKEKLKKEKESKKPKIVRTRYIIDKVNGAWHGDIH